jgi:hypothetical protein
MEGTKLCTIAIVCVVVSASLIVGQTYHIPAVSFNAPYDSVCPPDTHLEAVKSDLSNKISDVLATKLACGGYGWRQVAYLNMTDPDQTCPIQWRLYEQDTTRACGRQESNIASCDSVQFSSDGYVYTEVCGRITGYQHGSPDAGSHLGIRLTPGDEINQPYVDGVSITYGKPRKHIWSLYASIDGFQCCTIEHLNFTRHLTFIGNNYFCDSGNPTNSPWSNTLFTELPLWDGIARCRSSRTCCAPTSGPWFRTTLTVPTISDIEIRICGDQHSTDEDTPVGLIDVYIR